MQDLWVRGEISNFVRSNSGHLYFTLKDSTSALRCVMWKNTAMRLPFSPRDGQAVEAHGSINIYEAQGQYQLYADSLRPAGEGALYQEFLRLKSRLEAEGLFAADHKRPLPQFPRRIGIVTSPTGAALRDILNTLRRRYPLVEAFIAPTSVQGDEAPAGIVAAIQALNQFVQPDLILLARGGGSIEDLWAFNDERVARAIFASASPIICGVGHETDFTIADFVSDLRAPTPTASAELATPDRTDLESDLAQLRSRLQRSATTTLDREKQNLKLLKNRLAMRTPMAQVRSERQKLDDLSRRAIRAAEHRFSLLKVQILASQDHLAVMNPMAVMKRGFAIVNRPDGSLISSSKQVGPGDALVVKMSDGQFNVEVQSG